MNRATKVIAFLGFAVIATTARGAADPELEPSSDDLLCRFSWWDGCDGWLAANRWILLGAPSRRATPAPAPAGQPRPENAAARAKAHDLLVAAMGSKDVFVASEAALALGLAGDAKDVTTLAKIVAADDKARRMMRWSALGLGELPTGDAQSATDARKALVGALKVSVGRGDAFAHFWANCAYALAMRGDAAASPDLADLSKQMLLVSHADLGRVLYANGGEVVGATWSAVAALNGETFLPELEKQLKKPRTASDFATGDWTWSLVHAARRAAGAKALPLFKEMAKDDREGVRCMALQEIGAVAAAMDDDSAKILKTALASDRDPRCREMAAVALGRMGDASAAAAIETALEHSPATERPFLILGLALAVRASGDAKVSQLMVKSLEKSGSMEERVAWIAACGVAKLQGARAAIADLVPKNRQGPVSAAAAFALGQIGCDPAEKKLLHEAVAQGIDPTSRREAAFALALQHDHDVVTQLRAIVASKTPDIDRASAAVCLGLVGDDADVEALLDAEKNASDPLRACVLHGLGRLLDRAEGDRLARVVADGRWYPTRGVADPMGDLRGLVE